MGKQRSLGIGLYSLLGLCVGVYTLYTLYLETVRRYGEFWLGHLYWVILVIGLAYIILSPGIFILINWVRITLVVVSSIVASFFIVIPALSFLSEPKAQDWVWLVLCYTYRFFPAFLLSIYSLIYLTRPKVKEQFK